MVTDTCFAKKESEKVSKNVSDKGLADKGTADKHGRGKSEWTKGCVSLLCMCRVGEQFTPQALGVQDCKDRHTAGNSN
jgi:hypothetical protein